MTENRLDKLSLHKRFKQVIVVLVLCMLLYVGFVFYSGFDETYNAFQKFPFIPNFIKIIGLVIIGLLLRAARWVYYSKVLNWKVPVGENVLIFLASFAFTATPGKAGEIVKSAMLKNKYNISISESAGVLLVERLGDLLAVVIIGLAGLTMINEGIEYFYASMIIIVLGTMFVLIEPAYKGLFNLLGSKIPKLKNICEKCINLFSTGRSLLKPKQFIVGLLLAIMAWSCEAFALYYVFEGFGLDVNILVSFSIYGIATVLGALSMLPGGIGGFEVVMAIILTKTLNKDTALSSASTILIRFSTLWFATIVGMLFMPVWWLKYSGPKGDENVG